MDPIISFLHDELLKFFKIEGNIGYAVAVAALGYLYKRYRKIRNQNLALSNENLALQEKSEAAHRALQTTEERLFEINADLTRKLTALAKRHKIISDRLKIVRTQLPDTRLEKVRLDWNRGQQPAANRTILKWIDGQGSILSELMVYRSRWIAGLGDDKLPEAEWYAALALLFWPKNPDAASLYSDIRGYWTGLRREPSALSNPQQLDLVLAEYSSSPNDEADNSAMADQLERMAAARDLAGHYRLALFAVDSAMRCLRDTKSAELRAVRIVKLEALRLRIIFNLGRWDDVLELAQSLYTRTLEGNDDTSFYRLYARQMAARTLHYLARYDKALPLAREVEKEQKAALGEFDTDTLWTRYPHAI